MENLEYVWNFYISSSILCELLPCLFELCLFYLVWADQGDEISLEYAGTHALKGDLVRYEIFGPESPILLCFPSVILVRFGNMVQIWETNNKWND